MSYGFVSGRVLVLFNFLLLKFVGLRIGWFLCRSLLKMCFFFLMIRIGKLGFSMWFFWLYIYMSNICLIGRCIWSGLFLVLKIVIRIGFLCGCLLLRYIGKIYLSLGDMDGDWLLFLLVIISW